MSDGAVLVSGASGGIGWATVERFLADGYLVLGVDVVEPPEERHGMRSRIADVRDTEALERAVRELTEGLELKHVVAIAGRVVPEEAGLLDRDSTGAVEGFAASLELNLTGQFALVSAALPKLRSARGDRSITLCSSINALGDFGAPAYSAAKAGLIGLMHALAGPLGGLGIRVNVVAPGTTRTPLTEAEAAGDPSRFERAAGGTHLGRVADAGDVASAIEALAERMTHVTDQVLRVDGGQLLAN
jgi:3-oxoacyl-[acyl-carrier protein] reductase